MKTLPILLMYFLLLACADKPAEQAAIEDMLDDMMEASEALDVDRLLLHFTEDSVIEFQSKSGNKEVLNLDEYAATVELGWSLPADYDFEVENVAIFLNDDRMGASVMLDMEETLSIYQIKDTIKTSQQIVIKFVNHMPKIVALYAKEN